MTTRAPTLVSMGLLTITKAVEALGTSRRTMHRWINKGFLKEGEHFFRGPFETSPHRFDVEAINKTLAERCQRKVQKVSREMTVREARQDLATFGYSVTGYRDENPGLHYRVERLAPAIAYGLPEGGVFERAQLFKFHLKVSVVAHQTSHPAVQPAE